MSDKNTSAASGGIGFCGLLCILFIALKLTNVIGWSWWWVFSPLWGPPVAFIGLAVIGFVPYYLYHTRKK